MDSPQRCFPTPKPVGAAEGEVGWDGMGWVARGGRNAPSDLLPAQMAHLKGNNPCPVAGRVMQGLFSRMNREVDFCL